MREKKSKRREGSIMRPHERRVARIERSERI